MSNTHRLPRVLAMFIALSAGWVVTFDKAHAAPVLDQSCCLFVADGLTIEGNTRAQTFTVGQLAGRLTRLQLLVSSPAAGSLDIEIHGVIHGGDTLASIGPALAAGKLTWSSALTQTFVGIDLSPFALQVQPGQVLSFVERPAPVRDLRLQTRGTLWQSSITEPFSYPFGDKLTLVNNVFQLDPLARLSTDIAFKTFVDPIIPFSLDTTAVPLPSPAALLMLGVSMLAWRRREARASGV
jgi:hypothetical protein